MNSKSTRRLPILIVAGVVCLVCALRFSLHRSRQATGAESGDLLDLIERLERITYDIRVKAASHFPKPGATNLAFLALDDVSFARMNDGSLGFRFIWPWPRFVHGRVVRELKAQGALAVGFDILFPEEYPSGPETDQISSGGKTISSDDFFSEQIRAASNVVLAADGDLFPAAMFRTNASGIGNIYSAPEYGVLRRVKAFEEHRIWCPRMESLRKALDLDLTRADFSHRGKIVVPMLKEEGRHEIALKPDGTLDSEALGGEASDPPERPYVLKRIWNFGIVLAAMSLKADLESAQIEPGRVTLRGGGGVERVIEIDEQGYFYVDWNFRWTDIKEGKTRIQFGTMPELLIQDAGRMGGTPQQFKAPYKGRLVIIGSVATGNNITDQGATPLEEKTMLVTKHLNIANSVITGLFVRRVSLGGEFALTFLLGFLAWLMSRNVKVTTHSLGVLGVALAYVGAAVVLYTRSRYWVPMVLPLGGGLFLPHFCLVTYRLVFEQKEQRRVKAVFSKIVAPEVVQELLDAESLSLGGARRHITAFFADVRGFTEFTDNAQAAADEFARQQNLIGREAELYQDQKAAETLATVNTYLGLIADQIKEHHGTLDKYMGDCVMAFWGAPTPNPQHALAAVRAAIAAQRAIYALNQERFAENERRKKENALRQGSPPPQLLPLLQLGTGINSGVATVGLMGSDAHIVNYTVFGREVSLASRLETISQRGRIIISEATYLEIKRDDPALATTFSELAPVTVKGIRQPIKIYEVPWKAASAPKPAASQPIPSSGGAG